MTEAMKYWVTEVDMDGYRCDAAGFVPADFWNNVRAELDAIKPVFMLAEWESRDLHARAFDMTYALELERGDAPDRHRRGRHSRRCGSSTRGTSWPTRPTACA